MRRYYRKRKYGRKKRSYGRKRRSYGRRFRKYGGGKAFFIKRQALVLNQDFGANVVGDTDQKPVLEFTLDMVPNVSAYTNLWDQYRINGIKLRIVFSDSNSGYNTNQNVNKLQPCAFLFDPNDSSNLASMNDAMQTGRALICKPLGEKRMYIRPCPQVEIYKTISSGYGQAPRKMWLNTNYSNIPHYALKTYLPKQGADNYEPNVKIYATFYLSFRTQK